MVARHAWRVVHVHDDIDIHGPSVHVRCGSFSFRLILYRLETVDLRRMTGEEKLAFWINVHNALVMHVTFSTFIFIYGARPFLQLNDADDRSTT